MEIFGVTISMVIFWLIVAVVFAIIEGLTMGLTTIWFSGGAIVALISALVGAGLTFQIVIFFVVSILLLVFTRSVFVKKLHTGEEKTNIEALIGMEGVVISDIKPFVPGRIKLNGQEWAAMCKNNSCEILTGEKVKVVCIEGVKAMVSPLKK